VFRPVGKVVEGDIACPRAGLDRFAAQARCFVARRALAAAEAVGEIVLGSDRSHR